MFRMRLLPGPDSFNPILVREVRQMVRSRWIFIAMQLYLLALVGFAFFPVAEYLIGLPTEECGQMLCAITFGVMFTASLTAVTVHTVWRLVFDRVHEDLSFCSTLTPGRHVRGRLACGFIISLLFFSMAAPNLAASYLFRGVDIWIYFLVPPVMFLAIQIINLVVLAAFAPVRTPLQFLFYGMLACGIAMAGCGIMVLCGETFGGDIIEFWWDTFSPAPLNFLIMVVLPLAVLAGFFLVMLAGIYRTNKKTPQDRTFSARCFRCAVTAGIYATVYVILVMLVLMLFQSAGIPTWETIFAAHGLLGFIGAHMGEISISLAALILVAIIIPVTAYLFARCSLSPFSANRMRSIRIWMTFVMILSFPTMLFFTLILEYSTFYHYHGYRYRLFDPYAAWVPTMVGILSTMLILAVCERETWEGRVRRDIPKPLFSRALVFPFYTGSINGLAWVFLATFLLIAVVSISMMFTTNGSLEEVMWPFAFMILQMYVFNCSMAAFGLWKLVLSRWIPRDMIWAVTVALFFGLYMGTVILLEPVLRVDGMVIAFILVGIVIVWFLLTFLFSYPWLRGRFLDFTPVLEEDGEETS